MLRSVLFKIQRLPFSMSWLPAKCCHEWSTSLQAHSAHRRASLQRGSLVVAEFGHCDPHSDLVYFCLYWAKHCHCSAVCLQACSPPAFSLTTTYIPNLKGPSAGKLLSTTSFSKQGGNSKSSNHGTNCLHLQLPTPLWANFLWQKGAQLMLAEHCHHWAAEGWLGYGRKSLVLTKTLLPPSHTSALLQTQANIAIHFQISRGNIASEKSNGK